MGRAEPARSPPWTQTLPGILISLPPLTIPSPWGLLTQGSIQVLEDTAAVVQGDIDLLLQERGQQAASGTGPGRGQGSITPTVGSLPAYLCHFLSSHHLCPVTSGQPGAPGRPASG